MDLYASLLRRCVQPTMLSLERRQSVLRHYSFLVRSQYWDTNALRDYQRDRLRQLLIHSYDSSPYYRKIFQNSNLSPDFFRDFSDLQKLPLLTRADISSHADELVSTSFDKGSLRSMQSGGTTLHRIKILIDQESCNIKRASEWRFMRFMGYRPHDKIAFFWPAHIDHAPRLSWKYRMRQRYIDRTQMYYSAIPDNETLAAFYRGICGFRPDYLKVFPSALEVFLEYLTGRGLNCPRVRGIMSTGEILHPYQRTLFQDRFQCPVFDMYGSREVGHTACECEAHRGLHIAMETTFIECLNRGDPSQSSVEGDLVVTDLTNYAFPMIRYVIEDVAGLVSESCKCGRGLALMNSAVGRVSDRFYSTDGRLRFGGQLLTYILETGPRHTQSQLIQKSLRHFHVIFKRDPEPSSEIVEHYRQRLREALGADIEVTSEIVDEIPRAKSGKTRLFVCEVDPDAPR